MAFFTGEHECKLDAKGRLVLPSRLKSVLPEASKKNMIIRKGFEPNLILYPLNEFQNIYSRISSLNEFSSEQRKLKRNLFSSISQVELDSNGRFLLPKSMVSHCDAEKDIVLVGMGNVIELWSIKNYKKYLIDDSNEFSKLAQKYLDEKVAMKYHVPVLLKESIEGLSIKPKGTYLDLTFGGGGHSAKILEKLSDGGKLLSFDTDEDAFLRNKINNKKIELVKSNFKFFDNHIKQRGIQKVDGILADLGVSSYQIDKEERGFTYQGKTKMDMRMNTKDSIDAIEVINTYDQEKLEDVFFKYGDIQKPKKIVKEIIKERQKKKIVDNTDFVEVLNNIFKTNISFKLLSKFFQAIRIEVNDEINSLKIMLKKSADYLDSKGRLVVISYHSLEDRIVKNFINKSSFSSDYNKDIYGVKDEFFLKITKKPIIPSSDEINVNPRSRSAKLRIGERL